MKKILLIIAIFFGSFSFAEAQNFNNENPAEKVETLKIAFITQKLSLTTDEAQRFWPVYNRYEAEIKDVIRNNRNGDALQTEEKILNVKKKYLPEFTNVIGAQKSNALFNAEKEFRGVLMRHLKNH